MFGKDRNRTCSICGAKLSRRAVYCDNCGAKVADAPQVRETPGPYAGTAPASAMRNIGSKTVIIMVVLICITAISVIAFTYVAVMGHIDSTPEPEPNPGPADTSDHGGTADDIDIFSGNGFPQNMTGMDQEQYFRTMKLLFEHILSQSMEDPYVNLELDEDAGVFTITIVAKDYDPDDSGAVNKEIEMIKQYLDLMSVGPVNINGMSVVIIFRDVDGNELLRIVDGAVQ